MSDLSVTLPPPPGALTCLLCGAAFAVETGTTATLAAMVALDAHRVRDHDVWPSSMSRATRSTWNATTHLPS